MKPLTVFLVFFILGFDLATPQGKLLKAIEKLGKKIENGFNTLNEKLTNIQSQNEAKLDAVYNDIKKDSKNGFKTLNEKLTNVQSQNEDKLDAVYIDIKKYSENGFNTLNGKLTNVQSQNEEKLDALYNDIKKDSQNGFNILNGKLTNVQSQNLAKLDAVYKDINKDSENDFNTLNGKLTNIQRQNEEKLDAVYNDIKKDSENGFNTLNGKLTNVQCQNEAKIDATHFEDIINYLQKLSLTNNGITFEEYEACIMNGNHFDLNTGYCYKYVVLTDKGRNWGDAKVECEAQKGILASIKSREEGQFVKGILNNTPSEVYWVWLGGSDEQTEGTWVWTDGSSVSYSDWMSSEPNKGTRENCLVVYRGWNWQWGDFTCLDTAYAVCKIPA